MFHLSKSTKLQEFKRWVEDFIDHPIDRTWKFIKGAAKWVWNGVVSNARYIWTGIKTHHLALFRAGIVVASLIAFVIVLYCGVAIYFESQMAYVPKPDSVVYLGQNWGAAADSEDRLDYYYTPQGAFVHDIRYDWLVNLERPWKEERFATPDNMRSYGFIVDPGQTDKNPGGLPVGFARRYDPKYNEMMLDLTCAACHTGELIVLQNGKRTSVRIDGGSSHNDLATALPGRFAGDMFISLINTYINPFKFRRFAANMLKEQNTWHNRSLLGSEMWDVIEELLKQTAREKWLGIYPTEEGFGRTDGLGRIDNTAFAVNIDPKNYRVADAPVSYPAIWEMPLLDWVQYTASVRQPMARNIGEAMGTGARYYLINPYGRPLPASERFDASTKIANLDKIEHLMRKLTPPCWPADVFGPIDPEKAAYGKKLFNGKFNCVGCHGPHPAPEFVTASQAPYKLAVKNPMMGPHDADVSHWTVTTLAVQDIGTDPTSAIHFTEDRVDLSGTGMDANEVRKELSPYYQEEYARQIEYNQNLVTVLATTEQGLLTPPKDQSPSSTSPSPVQARRREFAQKTCNIVDTGSMDPLPATAVPLSPLTKEQLAVFHPAPTVASACATLSQLVQEGVDGYISQNLGSIDMTSVGDGYGLNYLITDVRKRAYQDMGIDSKDRLMERKLMDGYAQLDIPQSQPMYMARPLAGIWATPPFLHNGSVPSLYEMLLPAYQRTKQFYVKTPLFDPRTVGFYTNTGEKGAYLFDTSIRGNYNTGHEFRDGYRPRQPNDPPGISRYGIIGPAMSDDERWAIIEYLKIMRDNPDDTSCPESQYHLEKYKTPADENESTPAEKKQ